MVAGKRAGAGRGGCAVCGGRGGAAPRNGGSAGQHAVLARVPRLSCARLPHPPLPYHSPAARPQFPGPHLSPPCRSWAQGAQIAPCVFSEPALANAFKRCRGGHCECVLYWDMKHFCMCPVLKELQQTMTQAQPVTSCTFSTRQEHGDHHWRHA